MVIYRLSRPTVRDGHLLIPLTDGQLAMIEGLPMLEVQIRRHDTAIGAEHIRYYNGVLIPHIIRSYKELNGVTLSHGEVDLTNKKDANSGRFTSKVIDGRACIIFEDLEVSRMKRGEFHRFIENCNAHWSKLGISPPSERKDV
jgi:hypothetical protein